MPKKLLPVLITLIFTTSALCLSQEDDTELSNTMHASCVIKIVTTPDILPWNNIEESIYSILVSSNVGGKTAKQTLEITPAQIFWQCLNVDMISSPPRYPDVYETMISLSIDLDESGVSAPAPAVEEFLFALVEGLRQSLNKSYIGSQRIWAQQIAFAEENAATAEVQLRNLQAEQAELRAQAGLPDLSRDAILKDANNIKTQIAQEEFNLSSMDWRRDSVLKQMRFFHEKIREENNNVVLKGLEELISFHEKSLDTVKKQVEEGHVSADMIVEAEEKLARAKIELAQKKQQITNDAGGDKFKQLEFQFANFEIDKAETEKRLQYLQGRLGSTEPLLQQADQFEILTLKVKVAKGALTDALYKLEETKKQLNTMAPAVVLVGE